MAKENRDPWLEQDPWSKDSESDLSQSKSQWSSLFKGLSEGYPESIKSGVNAISELGGAHPFENKELGPTQNWQETLGRVLGQGGGYATLAAPLTAAGSALIPGIGGAALGAGLSGAALTHGGLAERSAGGLISGALPLAGKAAVIGGKLGKNYLFGEKPREAASILQNAYKKHHGEAVSMLEDTASEVSKRGVSHIQIEKSLFKKIKEEVPDKTHAFSELLKKAKTGDYDALRELQSDLRIKSEDLGSSGTYAERNLGKLVGELRDNINKSITGHLKKTGNEDLATKLTHGMEKYKQVMKTYHGNKRISKLVGPDEEIPDTLYKLLGRDTKYFRELRKAHPELDKSLKVHELQKDISHLYKKASKLGYAGALLKYLLSGSDHKK